MCVILCLRRAQAEGVSDNINKTKAALETSQSAIKKAEKEMTTALENLKNAQNITTTVNLYYYYQCWKLFFFVETIILFSWFFVALLNWYWVIV